ncbi:hypothetical protein B9Z55_007921 [Caenorhabditis nigoni]|uniref:BTB domain-containing protein n=1 Tax=Caenorhabditis nigoni TaxID=1611254 RepID=A0A2G5VBZ3_9PELO|nr:hypothetical protein B9Z55_007921 [Caenorhabditis nigoni]
MSVGGKKKLVVKYVFEDFSELEKESYGPVEEHFGVGWSIQVFKGASRCNIYLDCLNWQPIPWEIDTRIRLKILRKNEDPLVKTEYHHKFAKGLEPYKSHYFQWIENCSIERYLIDGNLTIEFEVEIKRIPGMEIPKRKFDNDVAKELSDVVLMAGDQKFYVSKNYLSLHSTYFKSLFSEKFADSEKSIIELKDIDPNDFQKFLEFYMENQQLTTIL